MPFKDLEKRKKYKKDWVNKNREKCRAASSRYYYKVKKDNPEKIREYNRSWHKNNPEKSKKYKLKYLYDYEGIIPNKCQVCNKLSSNKKAICIDHDHQTGKIRGFICMSCNIILGHVKDDLNHLKLLINYLEGNKNENKAA